MVELIEMTEAQFDSFIDALLPEYADDKVRAGDWSEAEAMSKARAQIGALLPDGPATNEHYLFAASSEGRQVGVLWLGEQERAGKRSAFIYEIQIFEQFRRRGYGAQTLSALEEKVRDLGMGEISLHVFGRNQAARNLYAKHGFVEVDVTMAKTILPEQKDH